MKEDQKFRLLLLVIIALGATVIFVSTIVLAWAQRNFTPKLKHLADSRETIAIPTNEGSKPILRYTNLSFVVC